MELVNRMSRVLSHPASMERRRAPRRRRSARARSRRGGFGRRADVLRLVRQGRRRSESLHQYGSATGRPKSPHYSDQVPLFVAHQLKPVWLDESEIARISSASTGPEKNSTPRRGSLAARAPTEDLPCRSP